MLTVLINDGLDATQRTTSSGEGLAILVILGLAAYAVFGKRRGR